MSVTQNSQQEESVEEGKLHHRPDDPPLEEPEERAQEIADEVVELDEDGHADVASAMRQCKTVIEDAQEIMGKLQSMSPEDSLPTWWSNKLAVASNNMNKMRDYIVNPIDEEVDHSEDEQLEEKKLDSFGRMVRYTQRGGKTADYITKKAKERSDLNKKNDPSMARRGYALSVTDREKAMKKARKRGLEPKYPTQKFGKRKLPEGIEDRHADAYERVTKHLDQVKSSEHKAKFQKQFDKHQKSFEYHYEKDTGQEHNAVSDMHDLASDIKKHNSAAMKKEQYVQEKTLTPAEKKKREEIAQAIARDDPKMPMDKKMAIATATAKRVAESVSDRTKDLIERAINRKT
jgi:hypothetical protein